MTFLIRQIQKFLFIHTPLPNLSFVLRKTLTSKHADVWIKVPQLLLLKVVRALQFVLYNKSLLSPWRTLATPGMKYTNFIGTWSIRDRRGNNYDFSPDIIKRTWSVIKWTRWPSRLTTALVCRLALIIDSAGRMVCLLGSVRFGRFVLLSSADAFQSSARPQYYSLPSRATRRRTFVLEI